MTAGADRLALTLRGEAAQEACGARLASACRGGLLIFLHGELGAGKTTMARGFLRALGHQGAVKSPTYTLIEPYAIAARRVYHLDLYRIGDPAELEYLGLREILGDADALMLVEWPERGAGWLPEPDLWIELQHQGDGRGVRLGARTARGREVLRRFAAHA